MQAHVFSPKSADKWPTKTKRTCRHSCYHLLSILVLVIVDKMNTEHTPLPEDICQKHCCHGSTSRSFYYSTWRQHLSLSSPCLHVRAWALCQPIGPCQGARVGDVKGRKIPTILTSLRFCQGVVDPPIHCHWKSIILHEEQQGHTIFLRRIMNLFTVRSLRIAAPLLCLITLPYLSDLRFIIHFIRGHSVDIFSMKYVYFLF